jgi:hypothetical protein
MLIKFLVFPKRGMGSTSRVQLAGRIPQIQRSLPIQKSLQIQRSVRISAAGRSRNGGPHA